MQNKTKQARQGDIWFERSSIPATAKQKKVDSKIVLAYGEATGHAHVVTNFDEVDMFVDANGDIFLSSQKPITIEHNKHGTIVLDPGEYNVTRQREYDAYAVSQERQVVD